MQSFILVLMQVYAVVSSELAAIFSQIVVSTTGGHIMTPTFIEETLIQIKRLKKVLPARCGEGCLNKVKLCPHREKFAHYVLL